MNKQITEISTSRILKHFLDNDSVALISSFRPNRTERENMRLLQELKKKVRKLGLGFTELISRWSEYNQETDGIESSDERALMVYGISKDDAMKFGNELEQSSIIFKDGDKCEEICTNDFEDYDRIPHKYGEVVRTYNVKSDTPLSIADAKEIFGKRKGGPASMPVKSNRSFRLTEMYEVEHPSNCVFSDGKERYRKIFWTRRIQGIVDSILGKNCRETGS